MVKKSTLSAFDRLKDLSIAPGAVFIGPWDGVDHEKYLIVAAVNPERILVCSVMINSLAMTPTNNGYGLTVPLLFGETRHCPIVSSQF